MNQHVFAWVAGFGWTFMPYAPFSFERVPGQPRSLTVVHATQSGNRQVIVTVADDGRHIDYQPGPGVSELRDVLDVIQGAANEGWTHGAAHDHWRIETSIFTVRWPEGFVLRSISQPPPVFDLVGAEEGRLWVQGPFPHERIPSPDRMEGPGQTTRQITHCAGGPLVELAYTYQNRAWRMFHCIVNRYPAYACVVTAQTPEEYRDQLATAVEEVATTLTPCPPG
jgi:hypothetical protein